MAYLLGVYEKAMPSHVSFFEKLQLAKAADYDYLELSVDETEEKLARLEMSKEEISAWKRDCEKVGIPVYSMCLSGQRKYPMGSRDGAVRKKSVEILKKAIDFSAYMGIRIIQLAGYDVYYEQGGEDTERWFFENLCECVRYAASRGVVLAFETMETPFMNTVQKAIKYVERVRSPYLQVYPDIGNVTNGASDPIVDLKCGEGHIVAAHLKETVEGVFRDMQFGEGRVDFVGCIGELKRQNVGLFVTEFWYDGKTKPLEYLQRTREFFRGKL